MFIGRDMSSACLVFITVFDLHLDDLNRKK